MNPGLVDGEKRCVACPDIILGLNGARLETSPEEVIDVIHGHLESGTFRKPIL